MKEKLSNTQKRIFWQKHIDAHPATNTSQVEYCRQHAISAFQFSYWKGKLAHGNSSPTIKPTNKRSPSSAFAQVKVQSDGSASGVTIHLSNGAKLTGINSGNYVLAVKLAEGLS